MYNLFVMPSSESMSPSPHGDRIKTFIDIENVGTHTSETEEKKIKIRQRLKAAALTLKMNPAKLTRPLIGSAIIAGGTVEIARVFTETDNPDVKLPLPGAIAMGIFLSSFVGVLGPLHIPSRETSNDSKKENAKPGKPIELHHRGSIIRAFRTGEAQPPIKTIFIKGQVFPVK